MQGVSDGFLRARASSARRARQVRLSVDGGAWFPVPFRSYQVDAARGDSVVSRYSGHVVLPSSVDPGVIDEMNTQVQVSAGFVVAGAAQLCTIATMTLYSVSEDREGNLVLECYSPEFAVEEAQFRGSYTVDAGTQCVAAIAGLLGVVPNVGVTVVTQSSQVMPKTTYDRDRWQAVRDIATGASLDVYADWSGQFVVADVPLLSDDPVFSLTGSQTDWGETRSRKGLPSVVAVWGNRTATGAVPYGVWVDDNAASPTYYLGTYGQVVRRVDSPILTTSAQCVAAATTIGLSRRGLSRKVTVQALPADFLEPGDVVTLQSVRGTEVHLLDQIHHSSSGPQTYDTRTIGADS